MSDLVVNVLLGLMGLMLTLMLAFIPAVWYAGKKLQSIESELKHGSSRFKRIEEDIECHDGSINKHEVEITKLFERTAHLH
jgi:hypothetical protein